MALLGLVLIVAQPYLRTARVLLLPPAAGRGESGPFLGIVVDDSLTARHAAAGQNRLDKSRDWLMRQVAALPDSARVVIAPTSFGQPTRPMQKGEALSFLGGMRTIPQPGDAAAALRNLTHAMTGRRGRIVVAAARSAALWKSPASRDNGERRLPVFFLDVTPCRADGTIDSVTQDSGRVGKDSWICHLRGEPARIRNKKLVLKDETGPVRVVGVSMADALKGEVLLPVPAAAGARNWTVEIEEDQPHAWLTYYFRSGVTAQRRSSAVILFNGAEDAALQADKVITAALIAVCPDISLRHVDSTTPDTLDLPDASVALLINAAAPRGDAGSWLDRQIQRGIRILCIPTPAGWNRSPAAEDSAGDILPRWAEPVTPPADGLYPLSLTGAAPVPNDLETLLLAGLNEMALNLLIEPQLPEATVVLATRDGRALVSVRRLTGSSSLWALGFPVSMAESSAVYHPVFPLLLKAILFPEADLDADVVDVPDVGDNVDVRAWFNTDAASGSLVRPDGSEAAVRCRPGQPFPICIDMPGEYVLKAGTAESVRFANARREPETYEISRTEWEAARPGAAVTWLTGQDRIELRSARMIIGSQPEDADVAYDLGAVGFALVLLFLLAETVFVFTNWRVARAA